MVRRGRNGKLYMNCEEVGEVLLNTPKGQKAAIRKNGKILARNGKPWMCSCTGKTYETATEFELKTAERKMVCPKCGKTLEIIKTPEDYEAEKAEAERKAVENIHLVFEDQSVSSGLKYYSLSARVDYETWKTIKDLFFYMNYDEDDEEQDTFGMSRLTGWLTTVPGKVEERLNVKPELRLEFRRKEAAKRKAEHNELVGKRSNLREQIRESFETEDATQPWADESIKGTQGASMINHPAGEEYEDPHYPFDIYGGGRSWIIDKEGNKIWQLTNNGHDGDNWGLNNVATGGAGAIGVYIPYSSELEQKIKKYVELYP